MILNKIEDPRDNLEKATRRELFLFAQANRISGVSDEMPAILIRDILRRAGKTRISIPPRPLGGNPRAAHAALQTPEQNGVQADAVADLARQWAQQQAAPAIQPTVPGKAEKPLKECGINELRRICQAEDIHMSRRDRMPDLIAKIEARRGENASQRH